MSNLKGHLLVPTTKNSDTGLWFIFHHESDGVLAVDLTREHADLSYRHFSQLSDEEPRDSTVLLGGPLQNDSAMMVLHNDKKAGPDSHVINEHFSFLSRRFVLVPGKPPAITNADNVPSKIELSATADVVISLGFRLWNMDDLEKELAAWQWNFLPATPQLVFHTKREERLKRARLSIN